MTKLSREEVEEIVQVAREKGERPNLSGTDLGGADLRQVNLSMADLSQANLNRTNLSQADLNGANLSGANLSRANLSNANLSNANLNGAVVALTIFADTNLAEVKGLETVKHLGPSEIGIHTLFNPGHRFPEIFLRGAGVPEAQITYLPSLLNQPIQFYSCFISHSVKDSPFATRLHNDLQARGVRCWYAPEDIAGGKKLFDQIDQAIRLHDKLLLILSDNSLQSEWVITEIRRARKLEVEEKQRKLFPIRLVDMPTIKAWTCFDADTGKDLAVEVREYHIPDFSTWATDPGIYQKGFDNLLRDLTVQQE